MACVVLPNCWQYYAIFLGVANQGGGMSGASHLFTDYELERQFKDSQCKIVFCDDASLERVLKAAKNCPRIQNVVVLPKKGAKNEYPFGVINFNEVLQTQPNVYKHKIDHDLERDILILPYSSGTTGSPKGVMLSHKNFGTMVNILMAHIDREITPHIAKDFDWSNEHTLLFLPFYHIYGFGVINNVILRGSTGVIMSHFDPEVFCRSIETYKIRMLLVVPPILVLMAKHPIIQKYNLSSVSFILSGAAPAGKDLCEEVMRKHPNVKHIVQGYGMTEMSMASHFPVITDSPNFGNAGKLASNLVMKIVDPETRKEVPHGERGEICISGPTVMMGYLNRPQATAETIDDEGWLRTGDIGYVDSNGYLFIVDRLKELIKVKGLQVPPAELEDLLLTHPLIQDAAVIGIPHEKDGEHPMAFVVRANESLKEEEVQEFVKARVAHYKQLKGGVQFIPQIPKSAAGKILRRFLRDEAEALRKAVAGKKSKL
uniref:4-coumarate--CoA ligase 1 n=1 Tax=Steinernema glaseri TaxID=37863 RepID=A0A1I8AE27_9BILA